MSDVILDSDVIIEVLRGNSQVAQELIGLKERGWTIACTPIAKAEIYHGLRPKEEAPVERFFAACYCFPITDEAGEKAGRYLAAYHKSHGTEIADTLVAAAAYVHKATLFTLNRKHYPMRDVDFHAPGGTI